MKKATAGLSLGLAGRSIFALTAARAEPVGVVGIILFWSGYCKLSTDLDLLSPPSTC